jgi:hypothetical protein
VSSAFLEAGLLVFILLLIAFFAFVLGWILLRFAQGIQSQVSDLKADKTIHIRTALGTLDVKPHPELHPLLAKIPKYPGATRVDSQPPEYEADLAVLGREFHIFVATYWTVTPADVVWEFYRRELVGWQECRKRGQGRSLTQETADGTFNVRVYTQNADTQIEYRLLSKSMTNAAAAGSGNSDSSFGVLR